MARFDLTDFEWSVIQPLLPNKPRGVPRVDDRRVLNGIFWRLRTGAPWADIPERYGSAHDVREPVQPLASGGGVGSASGGGVKGLRRRHPDDRLVQHPRASARRQRPKKDDRSGCMGRSRGGLTTKIHALVDAEGLPIALKLTEGQAHDGRSADDMLRSLEAGQILLADCAYDSNALRQTLAERGAWANVKPMARRKSVPAFSPFLYRYRNLVERFFNKLKHFRAIATRYDKNPDNYLAAIKLASARIWMRANESMA
jgi:transposase